MLVIALVSILAILFCLLLFVVLVAAIVLGWNLSVASRHPNLQPPTEGFSADLQYSC